MKKAVKTDLVKILKGAAIAMLGGLIVYLPTITDVVNFGEYAPLVGAVAAIGVNAIRKLIVHLRG